VVATIRSVLRGGDDPHHKNLLWHSLRQKIGSDSASFRKKVGVNADSDADTRDRRNFLCQFLSPMSPEAMESVGLSASTTVHT